MTPVGEILSSDMQNGVTVAVENGHVIMIALQNGKMMQRVAFNHDQALEMSDYLKIAVDRIARSGGSDLGEARRFDPIQIGNVLFPGVTMGMSAQIGHVFLDASWRNLVTVSVLGNDLVIQIIKNLLKEYEITFLAQRCEEMAEFFHRATAKIGA